MSITPKRRHNGRRVRKELDRFLRDHVWDRGMWIPRKLRKVRPYTPAEIELLVQLRATYIEAGRLRMVARGLYQYAKPGELTPAQEADWAAIKVRRDQERDEAIAQWHRDHPDSTASR